MHLCTQKGECSCIKCGLAQVHPHLPPECQAMHLLLGKIKSPRRRVYHCIKWSLYPRSYVRKETFPPAALHPSLTLTSVLQLYILGRELLTKKKKYHYKLERVGKKEWPAWITPVKMTEEFLVKYQPDFVIK